MSIISQRYDALEGDVVPVFYYYSVPEVLGLLAISSASIVDAVFLGNYVGSIALAAVSLSIPLWPLIIGISMMTCMGGSVTCGKLIGEKNSDRADQVYTSTALLNLVLGLVIGFFILVFMSTLVSALGATDEVLVALLENYIGIIAWFVPFFALQMMAFYFVRLDGQPRLASGALITAALVNVLLDWWLIGYRNMGMQGAAYATGVSAVVGCGILFPYLLSNRSHLKLVKPLTDASVLLRAYANGASEFVNEASFGAVALMFNWVIINRMGVDGVAALAIVDAMLIVGLEICFGISASLQPIISKNYGARKFARIERFLRIAVKSIGGVSLVMIFLIVLFPEVLVSVFLKPGEEGTVEIALNFMSYIWVVFLFIGFNILISIYLTSLEKPIPSALIAFSRGFALPTAFLLFLPLWFGDTGIYLAFPLAEALTFLIAIIYFLKIKPSALIKDGQP